MRVSSATSAPWTCNFRHLRQKLEPDPANRRWRVDRGAVGYKFELDIIT